MYMNFNKKIMAFSSTAFGAEKGVILPLIIERANLE